MLSKLFRFHGHNAVRRSYRQGISVRGPIGSLHVYVDSKRPQFKVAVVVSKKVHKSAVVRNRIRRRVYELVRNAHPNMRAQAELVFTVYQVEVAMMPAAVLKKEVDDLLKRANLLL
jgi:ribonuclease P protein component